MKKCWKKSRDMAQSKPCVKALAAVEKDGSREICSNDVKTLTIVSALGDTPVNCMSPIAVLSECNWEYDVCEDNNLGTYNIFFS